MSSSRNESLLGNSISNELRTKELTIRRLRKNSRILRKSLKELQENALSYRDLYIRQLAEMENFVKAKEREISIISGNASREVVKNLLPFIDSLESASRSNNSQNGTDSLRNQMLKILSSYGFREIESVGEKFDPYKHEAIGLVESDNDDVIVEEVQKGYMLKNEVLRTAKVIVGRRN